ncbi:MAG: hypothetical protein EXS46_02090 [Candidatus Taylorbacteria bacterium]|nr:hypothetical protein [Candidatus Taylorbacteria bacterium]
MTIESLNNSDFFSTADLALAAGISLSYHLEAIDKKNLRKAYFLFRRETGLDKLVQAFWAHELKVDPLLYFNALKEIKTRLYQQAE